MRTPLPSTSQSVLNARLRPPPALLHEIERTHIRSALAHATNARLVVFCAPAGYGKTSVMRQLHEDCTQGPVRPVAAWITLDDADNDLDRFLSKLRIAWQQITAERSEVRPAQPRQALGSIDFFNWLATATRPLVVFLDDFEALRNPVVLDTVRDLLVHLPQGSRLVLGTREQPRLNLGALRSSGRLLEFGPAELRLSIKETEALLRRYPRPLSSRTIVQLHERTDGWVTALQLAAHTVQKHPSPEAFASAFSGSEATVAHYLMDTVLTALSTPLREFVLLLGLLDEFDIAMARAVTGFDNASDLLLQLEQQNLFISVLDETRQGWRFHALFASFLRHEAARRLPERIAPVHRLASAWWRDHGRPVPAIRHALEADDKTQALNLLEMHAEGLLAQGRFRLLCRWFDELTAKQPIERPMLVMFHACALALTRRQSEALSMLDGLEKRWLSQSKSDLRIGFDADWLGAVRGLAYAMLDQPGKSLSVSQQHDRADAAVPGSAPHGMLVNALASALIAATRFNEATQVLMRAKTWHWSADSAFNMTVAECVHANLELVLGRLQDASKRLRSTLDERSDAPARAMGGTAALSVWLGSALYAQNQVPEARRLLRESLPFNKEAGPPDTLVANFLLLARCALAAGESDAAQQYLADMERMGHGSGLQRLAATAWLERARLALQDGAPALANDYLEHAALYDEVWARQKQFPANANDVEDLDFGRLRWQVRSGNTSRAIPALRQAIQQADSVRRRVRASLLRVLLAEALLADGQMRLAARQFADVVDWAVSTGHKRFLIDEGLAIAPLLLALLNSRNDGGVDNARQAFLTRVLAVLPQDRLTAVSPKTLLNTTSMEATPLSKRELEVLRMMAMGHSNRDIAEALLISENTVKAHLRSLNTKLEASNRTQAVANAQRLGWLPTSQ